MDSPLNGNRAPAPNQRKRTRPGPDEQKRREAWGREWAAINREAARRIKAGEA